MSTFRSAHLPSAVPVLLRFAPICGRVGATALVAAGLALCMGAAGTASAATYVVDNNARDASINACTSAPNDCSLKGAISRLAPVGDVIDIRVPDLSTDTATIGASATIEGNGARMARLNINNMSPLDPTPRTVLVRNARWENVTSTEVPVQVWPRHTLTLEDVQFRNNTSQDRGNGSDPGAILNHGTLVVRRGLFERNHSTDGTGGAIRSLPGGAGGSVLIEDSVFDANYGRTGAGAIHNTGFNGMPALPLTVRGTRFLRNGRRDPGNPLNDARGFFGAIKTDGVTLVERCYFTENAANYGAAIQSGGSLELLNTTIWGNTTNQGGEGGAVLLGGSARLSNVTIVGNAGTPGGGLHVYPAADVRLVNSLIADNAGTSPNISGPVFSVGNNLIRDTTGATITGTVASNLYHVDARWQTPVDNGGGIPTAALSSDSPAIDAGNECVLNAGGCGALPITGLTTDARGTGFPRRRGATVDIGAFESPLILVRNANSSGAGSLAQAIDAAQPGDTVLFTRPFFDAPRTINLAGTLVVDVPLTITGPGADRLTLDAGAARRHLNIDSGGNLLLSGIRFTRGDPGGTISGGAVLINAGGTLEARDVVLEDNAAHIGGCLYNVGTLTLARVRMANCRARAAAGAFFNAAGGNATTGDIRIEGSTAVNNGGAIGNAGNLLAFRVAMIGNQAAFGGALSEYGTTTLRNSTLSGNTASGAGGGGIHVDTSGRLTLTHATITRNHATTQGGGGIWNNGGVIHIQNSLVDGNTGAAGIPEVRGVLRSLGHNLIGNIAGSSFAPDSPSLVGNQLGVSARLSPLADNGGFGPTHAPLHDAPVLDAAASALGFDGRGLVRPRDFTHVPNATGGDGSDIGAYELQIATPTAVSATAGNTTVTVAFTGGARGGLDITAYTARCGSRSTSGSASPLIVTGLANGVAVTCTVTASAGSELGIASAPSNPVTPTIPIAFHSPPAGNGTYRQPYTHQLAASGVPAPEYDLAAGSLPPGLVLNAQSGLVSGQPTAAGVFSGSFRASNVIATPATQTFAITIAAVLPDPPSITGATRGNAQVSVAFVAPADNGGSAITGYTASCGAQSQSGPASPIVVTGLGNGTPVTCTVIATNAVGNSPPSAPSASVTPAGVPGPPTGVVATAGNSSASIRFAPPTDSGGSPILEYRVECMPGSVTAIGASSPVSMLGLTNGTLYACQVTARNAVGLSPPSVVAHVIPSSQPVADVIISASNGTRFVTGGTPTTYTVLVRNAGISGVADVRVESALAPEFTAASWTCSGQNGGRCAASGNGLTLDERVDLPAGASVTFVLTATVATLPETPISYLVSALLPAPFTDPDLESNVATDGPDLRGLFRNSFE